MRRLVWIGAALWLAAACSSFEAADTPAVPDGGVEASIDAPGPPSPTNDAATADVVDAAAEAADAADAGAVREFRYVFVTSAGHNGAFGPEGAALEGADALCKALADAEGSKVRGLSWRAFLGNVAVSPRDRVTAGGTFTREYRLANGRDVAFPKSYVFPNAGSPKAAPLVWIALDEKGATVTMHEVWTGATEFGGTYKDYTCLDWTSSVGSPGVGAGVTGWSELDGYSKESWMYAPITYTRACNQLNPIYCFEVD